MLADDGRGGRILLGGGSGIGKSRLLDELRIHALMRGALALPGQAVADGGASYQVLRDVLRTACTLWNAVIDALIAFTYLSTWRGFDGSN
jgi:hypothetical protein